MYDNVRGLCRDGYPGERKGLEQSESGKVGLSIR